MTISLFELSKNRCRSFQLAYGRADGRRAAFHGVGSTRRGLLGRTAHVEADLYGFARADRARATPPTTAIVAGLAGEIRLLDQPRRDQGALGPRRERGLSLSLGRQRVRFQPKSDLHFQMRQRQPFHSNALSFTARDGDGEILAKRMYFSIGGGFVVDEDEAGTQQPRRRG